METPPNTLEVFQQATHGCCFDFINGDTRTHVRVFNYFMIDPPDPLINKKKMEVPTAYNHIEAGKLLIRIGTLMASGDLGTPQIGQKIEIILP